MKLLILSYFNVRDFMCVYQNNAFMTNNVVFVYVVNLYKKLNMNLENNVAFTIFAFKRNFQILQS